jgi:hypothetical protein
MAARLGMQAATMRTRVHRGLAALRTHVAALRVWLMPGALSLKPALAVMIVFAAGGAPQLAPRPARSIPAAEAKAASDGRASVGVTVPSVHGRAIADGTVTTAPRARSRETRAPVSVQKTVHDPIVTSAVQRYDFENDVVDGILQRPGTEGVIEGTVRAKQESLIELRREFVPEMLKSLEDF